MLCRSPAVRPAVVGNRRSVVENRTDSAVGSVIWHSFRLSAELTNSILRTEGNSPSEAAGGPFGDIGHSPLVDNVAKLPLPHLRTDRVPNVDGRNSTRNRKVDFGDRRRAALRGTPRAKWADNPPRGRGRKEWDSVGIRRRTSREDLGAPEAL